MSGTTNSAGPVLWIDDDAGTIGTVDVATDAVSVIGNSGVALTDIAFSPTDQLYGISFSGLYSVNTTTGAATSIGSFGGAQALNGLVFSSSGALYASGGSDLYTINTTTGAASLVGDLGLGSGYASAGDLAFNGGALYETVGTAAGASDLVRVNPVSGAGVIVGQITDDPGVFGLVTGANGTLYGIDGQTIYSISTTTGAGTKVESYAGGLGAANGAAAEGEATPCYAAGTRILTQRGEVAVERLQVGDRAAALLGQGYAEIRWLGHRRLDLRAHPAPDTVQPIRILAGAFGEGQPLRDLRVSPGHALYVDGVLVQAVRLVNGASIVQEAVDAVTYWHVELERHDVLLAEGLPAESYLDTGNRAGFASGEAIGFVRGGPALELPAELRAGHWAASCAPLAEAGPALEAVRARLIARAAAAFGLATTSEPDLHLLVDGVRLAPAEVVGRSYRFCLPAGCRDVRLGSRVWVPGQVLAGSTDARVLGVCVRELRLDGGLVALDGAALAEGWQPAEDGADGGWRWTAGAGLLPAGVREVVVQLDGDGCYRVEASQARAAA